MPEEFVNLKSSSNTTALSAVILAAGEGKRFEGTTKLEVSFEEHLDFLKSLKDPDFELPENYRHFMSSRENTDVPKQFVNFCGKPLIAHSLETFQKCESIEEIIVVAPSDYMERTEEICKQFGIRKAKVTAGGETRFESARLGFEQTEENGFVVFHDAARPLVSEDCIFCVISDALQFGAASMAVALDDSIKKTHIPSERYPDRYFQKNILRSDVWLVQTPQAFKKSLLREMYENFSGDPSEITDEASLFEESGREVIVTPGKKRNMKITTSEDFIIAETIGESIKKGVFRVFDFTA